MSSELSAVELDAMPVGEVVVDRDGDTWVRNDVGSWVPGGLALSPMTSENLVTHWGPLRRSEKAGKSLSTPSEVEPAERKVVRELSDALAYALQIRDFRSALRQELEGLLGDDRDGGELRYDLRKIIDRFFPEG